MVVPVLLAIAYWHVTCMHGYWPPSVQYKDTHVLELVSEPWTGGLGATCGHGHAVGFVTEAWPAADECVRTMSQPSLACTMHYRAALTSLL